MSDSAGAALAGLGWKIAGEVISTVFGTTFTQYRPGYVAQLSGFGTIVNSSLPGYMTANAYQKTPVPLDPAKPRCHAVFDPSVLRPGDFLVGPLAQGGVIETFFIATVQPPAPPSAVRCNALVDVSRAVRATVFGAQSPLDTQIGTEEAILVGWPASMLPTGRSAAGPVQLPDDVNLGAYTVWLPPSIPVALRAGDAITNTSIPGNMRSIVAAADQTADGWRLLVQQASA